MTTISADTITALSILISVVFLGQLTSYSLSKLPARTDIGPNGGEKIIANLFILFSVGGFISVLGFIGALLVLFVPPSPDFDAEVALAGTGDLIPFYLISGGAALAVLILSLSLFTSNSKLKLNREATLFLSIFIAPYALFAMFPALFILLGSHAHSHPVAGQAEGAFYIAFAAVLAILVANSRKRAFLEVLKRDGVDSNKISETTIRTMMFILIPSAPVAFFGLFILMVA